MVLCTLNAKYIHASLGLRYLLANMGDLRDRTVLREYTIARDPQEMADALLLLLGPPLAGQVQVVGFGVYIWNVTQTCALVRLLKQAHPALKIVLGGPEVSHELEGQAVVALADHVVTGWGDISFPKLCRALLFGPQPLMKVIAGEQPPLDQIALPYAEYSAADLAHRVLYVEASRGCPFKCEFCLSSLDKTAWAFDLERFLEALDGLYRRGARTFKFVDRTFNLKIGTSLRILQFFLDRLPQPGLPDATRDLFVHFELIPDHLPERLKQMIARFPPGVLQFEVGIQTFNLDVQRRISRQQDNLQTVTNLRWLREFSHAHLHTDLIFGLPGESLHSFAQGFDQLVALRPHEIQLGLLKRLRGTPIARHSAEFGMLFDAQPPYAVRETGAVGAAEMLRFTRLSRYWELIANSGRFQRTLAILLGEDPTCPVRPAGSVGQSADTFGAATESASAFYAFLDCADWLWARTGATSQLTPEMLVDHLFDYLCSARGADAAVVLQALQSDYLESGARARPQVLRHTLPKRADPAQKATPGWPSRQAKHRAGARIQPSPISAPVLDRTLQ